MQHMAYLYAYEIINKQSRHDNNYLLQFGWKDGVKHKACAHAILPTYMRLTPAGLRY